MPSEPVSIINVTGSEGNRAFGYKAATRLNGLFKKVTKDGELEEIERKESRLFFAPSQSEDGHYDSVYQIEEQPSKKCHLVRRAADYSESLRVAMHEPTANMNLLETQGKLVHDRFDVVAHDGNLGVINLRIDHGCYSQRGVSTL